MTYNLYFVSRKTGVQTDDPFAWGVSTLVKARKLATDVLKRAARTAVAIYQENGIGMEIYAGKVQWEDDAYFFHSQSGKKWRIHTDGRIIKLKKKAAPFGL